ncbi:hypothetical protein BDB01DRAFT_752809 [Pilobolus umbonatus]|nr:hypothetical protein BDB01DRAFT_752809 [Pilobolus umbonatus]
MSYYPSDSYQYTYNVENDPYRIIKKSSNIDSPIQHSPTPSHGSTNEYSAINSTNQSMSEYDDPYATAFYNNRRRVTTKEERANSYLPYSHHARDPDQKTTPIYLEDEYTVPASNTLGVGSILQDNRNDYINPPVADINNINTTDVLPEISKRKRQRQCCGLNYRLLMFISAIIIAVVVVIWYFVWPRIPTLALDDVDNTGKIIVSTNTTKKYMSANWLVNMTTANSENWVPTRISSIHFVFIDKSTDQPFGQGSIGSMVLPAKQFSIITFPVEIKYETDDLNDVTFQDLYNACGIQVASPVPFENQQGLLNVAIQVTYKIHGIAWSTHKLIPAPNLVCPTS